VGSKEQQLGGLATNLQKSDSSSKAVERVSQRDSLFAYFRNVLRHLMLVSLGLILFLLKVEDS
jgi:hypothetical protein